MLVNLYFFCIYPLKHCSCRKMLNYVQKLNILENVVRIKVIVSEQELQWSKWLWKAVGEAELFLTDISP